MLRPSLSERGIKLAVQWDVEAGGGGKLILYDKKFHIDSALDPSLDLSEVNSAWP